MTLIRLQGVKWAGHPILTAVLARLLLCLSILASLVPASGARTHGHGPTAELEAVRVQSEQPPCHGKVATRDKVTDVGAATTGSNGAGAGVGCCALEAGCGPACACVLNLPALVDVFRPRLPPQTPVEHPVADDAPQPRSREAPPDRPPIG